MSEDVLLNRLENREQWHGDVGLSLRSMAQQELDDEALIATPKVPLPREDQTMAGQGDLADVHPLGGKVFIESTALVNPIEADDNLVTRAGKAAYFGAARGLHNLAGAMYETVMMAGQNEAQKRMTPEEMVAAHPDLAGTPFVSRYAIERETRRDLLRVDGREDEVDLLHHQDVRRRMQATAVAKAGLIPGLEATLKENIGPTSKDRMVEMLVTEGAAAMGQFMVNFLPVMQTLKAGRASNLLAGGFSDALGFNPDDGNLATMADKFGMLPEMMQWLRSDAADSRFEGRMLNALEGGVLGELMGLTVAGAGHVMRNQGKDAIIEMLEAYKGLRNMTLDQMEESADAVLRSNASQLNAGLDPSSIQAMTDKIAVRIARGLKRGDVEDISDELYDAAEAALESRKIISTAFQTDALPQDMGRRTGMPVASKIPMKDGVTHSVERLKANPAVTDTVEVGRGQAGLEQAAALSDRIAPERAAAVSSRTLLDGSERFDFLPRGARKTVGDLAYALQARTRSTGYIHPMDRSDEAAESLAQGLADEVDFQLSRDDSAIGWYGDNIAQAMDIMSTEAPEVLQPGGEGGIFRALLSVASNGLSVDDNFVHAWRLYQGWKATGTIDVVTPFGGKVWTSANQPNLMKLQNLIDNEGVEGAVNFLNTEMTVRDLKQLGFSISGEPMDGAITGSGMFGAKLGSFFNNLNGKFDTLTMDRWYQRTFNRHTGNLIGKTTATREKNVSNLRKMLMDETELQGNHLVPKEGSKLELFEYSVDDLLEDESTLEAWAKDVHRAFATDADGSKGTFNNSTPLRRAAKALDEGSKLLNDAPRGAGERTWERHVMTKVQQMVQERGWPRVEMADLQALLWFHEKDLYAQLGVGNITSEATNYAIAAQNLIDSLQRGRSSGGGVDGGGRVRATQRSQTPKPDDG